MHIDWTKTDEFEVIKLKRRLAEIVKSDDNNAQNYGLDTTKGYAYPIIAVPSRYSANRENDNLVRAEDWFNLITKCIDQSIHVYKEDLVNSQTLTKAITNASKNNPSA